MRRRASERGPDGRFRRRARRGHDRDSVARRTRRRDCRAQVGEPERQHRALRIEEVRAAGDEVVVRSPPRRPGVGAGSGCGRPRTPPVARSRTRRAADRWIRRRTKRRDTGPTRWRGARARASKVARSRTRQIRPRAASGHGPGGPEARLSRRASASGYENRGSSNACGYWVGRYVSRRLASSKVTARTRSRDPRREAEHPSVPVRAAGCATRRAAPGPQLPLVGIPGRCYVSTPRGATAGTRELPR